MSTSALDRPEAFDVPWDPASRPTRDVPERRYSTRGIAVARSLVQAHDELRESEGRVDALLQRLVDSATAADASDGWNMQSTAARREFWRLGNEVVAYCSLVSQHHFGEDDHIFPLLRGREPALDRVLDQLVREHEVIHALLGEIDRALVALVGFAGDPAAVRAALHAFNGALASHLLYEERELMSAMALYLG